MHGSILTLLALAASATVPVFSAPVPQSQPATDGGPGLVKLGINSTESRVVCHHGQLKVMSQNGTTESASAVNIGLNTTDGTMVCQGHDLELVQPNKPRDADSVKMQARDLIDVLKRFLRPNTAQARSAGDDTPESLAARDHVDDLVALLSHRDLNLGQEMQSVARDHVDDLVALLNHRDLNPGQEMQSVARDIVDDYITSLNGRDIDPEAEIKARGSFLSELAQLAKVLARRDVTDDEVATRDAPGMTSEQLHKLAMVMARSLDDLE